MAIHQNNLNSTQLNECPLPAAEYNLLPHINDLRDAAAHAHLWGLIAVEDLCEIFSIHLIHKHFDMVEDRIMVCETVKGCDQQPFVVSCPHKVERCDPRGLQPIASLDGPIQAYEYTTDEGADLSEHADFVSRFSRTLIDLGFEKIFALTAKKINEEIMTEFELGDLRSTALVHDASWLPDAVESEESTTTDWNADAGYAKYVFQERPVPGIIQLKCLETRMEFIVNRSRHLFPMPTVQPMTRKIKRIVTCI